MNETQNYIQWDERLMLDIPVIDRQHENLVRMANNLHLLCTKSKETDNQRFLKAAHEAITYIRYHFSCEEKLMCLLEFSEFSVHKREHEDFVMEILTLAKQFEDGKQSVQNHFMRFIKEWILSHITVSDRAFADFFMSMKNHAKLKLILAGRSELSVHPVFGTI